MSVAALVIAATLDAAFAEPKWLWSRLPHPAVVMGRAVGALDRKWNAGPARRAKGIAAVAVLVLGAGLIGAVIAAVPAGPFLSVVLAAILLAQGSLVQHVRAVAKGLDRSLPEGRKAVAMIVGRDTADMDEPAIASAAIESAAENLSDGVIAPAFWFLIGGLPGILIYKVVNTADSMIGYRTPRHEQFGWAAARLDDVLNLIPARLTGILIALTHSCWDWRNIMAEARQHRSPNAGWPEAAMARAIGVRLSGPRSYDGKMRDFPYVNPTGTPPDRTAIRNACRALWRAWGGGIALILIWAVV